MAQGAKAQVENRGAQAPQLLPAKVNLGKLSLDRAGLECVEIMNSLYLSALSVTINLVRKSTTEKRTPWATPCTSPSLSVTLKLFSRSMATCLFLGMIPTLKMRDGETWKSTTPRGLRFLSTKTRLSPWMTVESVTLSLRFAKGGIRWFCFSSLSVWSSLTCERNPARGFSLL